MGEDKVEIRLASICKIKEYAQNIQKNGTDKGKRRTSRRKKNNERGKYYAQFQSSEF